MATPLEQFTAECRTILTAEPGPSGRRKICMRLEQLLRDPDFVKALVTERTPERHVLYEDPQLKFCVLAHKYDGAKDSPPHDHGPSWAIYGQAQGETEMNDYALLEPASAEKPGKVKKTKTYKLTPGVAHVYNEGDLHSPKRVSSTKLIRIEGVNMEKVKRFKFELVS